VHDGLQLLEKLVERLGPRYKDQNHLSESTSAVIHVTLNPSIMIGFAVMSSSIVGTDTTTSRSCQQRPKASGEGSVSSN
jgi:hypothetical protein